MTPRTSIYDSEAQTVDIPVIQELAQLGWKVGDTLLYRPQYKLTSEQQKEYTNLDGKLRNFIEPDCVLQDFSGEILAVIEDKLEQKDEQKAIDKLRLLYGRLLKPRFLYACSKERKLFYDTAWRGLDAGEFRRTTGFMSLEEMKIKLEQQKTISQTREIHIDTTIAGGFDPDVGKERYYQLDCIKTLIDKYRAGETKMLVHMATGLGKTRLVVALSKALLSHGLAKRILFVVDRRILAKQALDEGFSLISREHTSTRIRTTNFRQQKHVAIHVVVIDTLERIFQSIPNNFYDLMIVDECHRSISVSRKVIFDHFLCPRIGLTATPRHAIAKEGKDVAPEDLEIRDTYKLFGCESGEATYTYDLDRGIEEGFLAEYDVLEILTYLTKEAEKEGIPIEYVLDPDTRARLILPQKKRLKLEQLERKYLSEERCKRIAEEIRTNTKYGEKVILFGVSQTHCQMLCQALNEVFKDDGSSSPRYAEAIISDNNEVNEFLKNRFKKPYQNPFIVVSVDIMTTGVNVKCIRYIAFAALTKSVGKYIQMIGRGTRLDPKTGKFSFRILDFVGLCRRMNDNRRGTERENLSVIFESATRVRDGRPPRGDHFIIPNADPAEMIQRVFIHGDDIRIIDNIPIDKAKEIFEQEVQQPQNTKIKDIQEKIRQKTDYVPSDEELQLIEKWLKDPEIFLEEGQLQKMYKYPDGTNWDFLLHVMGIKKIPSPKERIQQGYEAFLKTTSDFNDEQLKVLTKLKDIFASNLSSNKEISLDTVFSNPIYERLIGKKDKINQLFSGKFDVVVNNLKGNLRLPNII